METIPTMKLRVSLTIEVDADAWQQVYGDRRDAMRESVRSYVHYCIAGSAAAEEGAITAVKLNDR